MEPDPPDKLIIRDLGYVKTSWLLLLLKPCCRGKEVSEELLEIKRSDGGMNISVVDCYACTNLLKYGDEKFCLYESSQKIALGIKQYNNVEYRIKTRKSIFKNNFVYYH